MLAGTPTAVNAASETSGAQIPAPVGSTEKSTDSSGRESWRRRRFAKGAKPKTGGTFRALRARNYRLYATGQLVSLTGTWMQRVAIDWLVLDMTNNSGTLLGLVTMLQFAPSILLSPFGGVLADRVSKRKLLICTQTCTSLCALVLGILTLTDVIQLWQVFAVAGALGIITALDGPGRQSFVIEMVGSHDLQNAVALNSAIFNSSRLLGLPLGGFVLHEAGTAWAFLGNAIFTFGVVGGLLLMRPGELHTSPLVARAKGQLREGLRYIQARRPLWIAISLAGIVGIFGQSLQLVSALMIREVFHGTAQDYSLLTSALAVGAFAGAIRATRRTTVPSTASLVRAAFLFGAIEVLVGVAPGMWTMAFVLMVVGYFMISFTTSSNAIVQLGIEPSVRGRVMSMYMVCAMGGSAVGGPIIGYIAELTSPRAAVMFGGAAVMAAAVAFGMYVRGAAPSPSRTELAPVSKR